MYYNIIIFVVLLIMSIVLSVKRMPILGLAVGMFTIILGGAVFLNDVDINVFFTYFLMVMGFICMIINGLDIRRKS